MSECTASIKATDLATSLKTLRKVQDKHAAAGRSLLLKPDSSRDKHVILTTQGSGVAATSRLPALMRGDASMTMDAHEVLVVARDLGDKNRLVIQSNDDIAGVTMEHTNGRYLSMPPSRLPPFLPDQVPSITEDPSAWTSRIARLEGQRLYDAARLTRHFLSKDVLRSPMMRWCVESDDSRGSAIMTATDAHKLTSVRLEGQVYHTFLLHPGIASALHALKDDFVDVYRHVNSRGASVLAFLARDTPEDPEADRHRIVLYASEGTGGLNPDPYPDWRKVVPDHWNPMFEVDRLELIAALRRARVFTAANVDTVRLFREEASVYVEVNDITRYGAANPCFRERLPSATYDVRGGNVDEVGFNRRYLEDIARSMSGERLVFGDCGSNNRAFHIKGKDDLIHEGDITILMPIMLHTNV